MKKILLLSTALAVSACFSAATATTLTVGSPNNNNYAGDVLSPRFGIYINFDDQTPFNQLATNAYASKGVQSISSNTAGNPLFSYPYSSQSAPNYISTASAVTGGITITFTNPTNIVGIGVLESDGFSDTLQALGATGNVLGSFIETVSMNGATPFNAYYVLQDPTSDIKSLVISSASGNFGVDDLQFAPEPYSMALVTGGLLLLVLARFRKVKANGEV